MRKNYNKIFIIGLNEQLNNQSSLMNRKKCRKTFWVVIFRVMGIQQPQSPWLVLCKHKVIGNALPRKSLCSARTLHSSVVQQKWEQQQQDSLLEELVVDTVCRILSMECILVMLLVLMLEMVYFGLRNSPAKSSSRCSGFVSSGWAGLCLKTYLCICAAFSWMRE